LRCGPSNWALRLEHIEGCVERGRARRIPGTLRWRSHARKPAAKRPGFAMAVDDEVGKTRVVACVKEWAAVATLRRTSVLLTALDHRPLDL
jgi:hypothetical protein